MRCVVIKPRRTQNRRSQNARLCKAGTESCYYDIAEWWESHQKNIRFKEPLIQRFMVATPLPTIRDQRTLTGWVTPATENNSPASAGLFI